MIDLSKADRAAICAGLRQAEARCEAILVEADSLRGPLLDEMSTEEFLLYARRASGHGEPTEEEWQLYQGRRV